MEPVSAGQPQTVARARTRRRSELFAERSQAMATAGGKGLAGSWSPFRQSAISLLPV